MNKTSRAALIVAGTAFSVGLLFYGAGILMGGRTESRKGLPAHGIDIGGDHGVHVGSDGLHIGGEHGIHIGGSGAAPETDRFGGTAQPSGGGEVSPFTELEVEVDLGDIRLETGETYSVALLCNEDYCPLRYSSEKGKLTVWSEDRDAWMWDWPELSAEVVVTVPAGAALGEVELSTALGDIRVDCAVTARTAELSTDLGEVNCAGLNAGELEAGSDLGNVTVDLPGPREDYRWELETGMGDVKIDGETRSGGIGDITHAGGSGRRQVKADSDMGDVEITFSAS